MSSPSCKVLNNLRASDTFCDAVIKVEDGSFPIHRIVMSACSPFFRALFTNGMRESTQREVMIHEVRANMMQIMIEFAYTRQPVINTTTVEELLPLADQFHLLELVKAGCDFVSSQLDYDNCLGIKWFAGHYFFSDLEQIAHRYILKHFPQVAAESDEFLELSLEEVIALTSADTLHVKNEEIVFGSIIRWVNYHPEERKQHMFKLLNSIRVGLFSLQCFLENVKKHPYIKNNEECHPLILETLKFLYGFDMDNSVEVELMHYHMRPRFPYEILFAIGGWSGGNPINIIETYDSQADCWMMIDSKDKAARAYHGCASLGGLIYVFGGFDGTDYFNAVRTYNPISKVWRDAAPMHTRRCYVSVAVLDDQIYAMGGFDGHVRQNTVERYTPRTNQWTFVASMSQRRSDASACSLEGRLYICGGFNGHECLSSCETYDPATDQWTLIAPMQTARSGVGTIEHCGSVYSVGGFNGITRMASGERWSQENNTWTSIPSMYTPRSNFGIGVIDDMLFTIGGFNGITTTSNVERLDLNANEWFDCTEMNINCSALSVCIIEDLPNVQDFISRAS